jgi:hypothetical protein
MMFMPTSALAIFAREAAQGALRQSTASDI